MGFIVQGRGGSAKEGSWLDDSQLEGHGLRPVLVVLLPGELPQVSLFCLLDGKLRLGRPRQLHKYDRL